MLTETAMRGGRRYVAAGLMTIAIAMVSACSESSEGIDQIGDPPTVEWPSEHSCPTSLRDICGESDLELMSTVNLSKPSAVNAAASDSKAELLCTWPLTDSDSCKVIGPNGETVSGEAAIYLVEADSVTD